MTHTYTIFYSRVSTNLPDQIKSLQNQIQCMEKYALDKKVKNKIMIASVVSASKGMDEKVKNIIMKKKGNINIVVKAIDRLTRNTNDINFIKNNIKTIFVLDDEKKYNVIKDINDIEKEINFGMQESKKIKIRISVKRKSYDLSDDDKLICAKKRCIVTNNIMSQNIESDVIENIKNIITESQNIKSEDDWKKILLYNEKSNIRNLRTKTKINKRESYHMMKKDITKIISDILSKNNVSFDKVVLNEIINANINLGKKIRSINDKSVI
jgi:hypothetical protein